MITCSYCSQPATSNVLVRIGSAPSPKKQGTQADTSRLEIIKLCPGCLREKIIPLLDTEKTR